MTTSKKFQITVFLMVLFIGLFLRFNNFSENIQFHLDPPLFMREVKDMVDEGKIRLIGPMVASKEIQGRVFFTGPYFYWILAILGIITGWNIVLITGFFAILWMLTFVAVFFWLKKKYGFWPSLFVFAILTFSNYLLAFSRIIWNVHFTPILGVFILYFLEARKEKSIFYFLAGIFFGIGVSIHYGAIPWLAFPAYFIVSDFKDKKFNPKNWTIFFVGIILMQFPLILFELKHDFYNLRTMIFHFSNFSGEKTYTNSFLHSFYYYIFPFFPFLCLVYAKFLKYIQKKWGSPLFFATQIFLVVFLLYQSLFTGRVEALINPDNWNIKNQQKIVDLIVADNEKGFEVAALVGPETRAEELRWWLRLKNHNPMSVLDYDKTDILYVVAPTERNIEEEWVWEVLAIRPFIISYQEDISDNLRLYKLARQKMVQ